MKPLRMIYTLTELKTKNGYSKSYTLYEDERQFCSITHIKPSTMMRYREKGKLVTINPNHPWFKTIKNKCTQTGTEIDLSSYYPLQYNQVTINIEVEI
jgi:hypothetical protein